MHLRLLEGRKRDAHVVVGEKAVAEPVGDGREEASAAVGGGRVERNPGRDQRRRRDERQPQPESRRERWCEREQQDPERIRGARRLLEP